MERRKRKMSCFRDGQGRFNGLEIAHFTDEHDIGVLPENIFQCVLERFGVGIHLPLVYQAFFMRMEILDRIFDGDDMFLPFAC